MWVETDSECEVEVLGCRDRTFEVAGHHYALVHLTGLAEGAETPYAVSLNGLPMWPPSDDTRAGTIRTLRDDAPLRLAFGSCRVAVPHEPPYTLTKDEDEEGKGSDALYALAMRMMSQASGLWPHALVMLGDQVYADEGSPAAREFIRGRRDVERAPGIETADFEEYTRLYWESWREPTIRWLFSTVPSTMIFDDHEVADDWNSSQAWMDEQWRLPWYRERLISAYMSYWIYQHIGNLSPTELAADAQWRAVRAATGDAEPVLRAFAERAARSPDGTLWSFSRDFGRTRLVVVDSRGGRLLAEDRRRMVDDAQWRWIVEHARGDVDHLLIGSSLPVFLVQGVHYLESWNEAVCGGAWGRIAARLGERLRRAFDLEHWPAFHASFDQMVALLGAVGGGARGTAPATVVMLGGDVHHAYIAQVGFPARAGVTSAVYQAVCSPFRNPLDARERRVVRMLASRTAGRITRLMARAAGIPDPAVRWRLAAGPLFDNQVGTIETDGRRCRIRIEKVDTAAERPRLSTTITHRLA